MKNARVQELPEGLEEAISFFFGAEESRKPTFLVFYSLEREKLFEEFPDDYDESKHVTYGEISTLPNLLVLGDDEGESYEIGLMQGDGFYRYVDQVFIPADEDGEKVDIGWNRGMLNGMHFLPRYNANNEKGRETCNKYLKKWGCYPLPEKKEKK